MSYGREGGGREWASREELAHEHATQDALSRLGDVEDYPGDAREYWDKYYDIYYSAYDKALEDYLSEPEPVRNSSISQDEELRDILNTLLEIMGRTQENEETQDYAFFRTERQKDELFRYCQAIAEYLKKENIADLVIIDRSARPLYVGVLEYLRKIYPGEKIPNIVFLNPKGFKTAEEMTGGDYVSLELKSLAKDESPEFGNRARTEAEILEEFQQVYKGLMEDKDKPVLVFDTCIHSGDSLGPIKDAFLKRGFKDVRIGSVNPADGTSRVKTDFYISREEPAKGCYPFDQDRMIEKTFDHVYSRPTQDRRRREMAILLRREIKKIVTERVDRLV